MKAQIKCASYCLPARHLTAYLCAILLILQILLRTSYCLPVCDLTDLTDLTAYILLLTCV